MTKFLLHIPLLIGLLLATPAWADFQAGIDAYKRGDYETAMKEFRSLAEQGNTDAQYALGVLYDKGQGLPQNYQQMMKWYRLAAEQGQAMAQSKLGLMYSQGKGVPQNDAKAAKWTRRAAEQGHTVSQSALGIMYYVGEGVPQDSVLAHMWLNLAVSKGQEEVVELRDAIATILTPQQLAEAQRLAREWKPKGK